MHYPKQGLTQHFFCDIITKSDISHRQEGDLLYFNKNDLYYIERGLDLWISKEEDEDVHKQKGNKRCKTDDRSTEEIYSGQLWQGKD